MSTSDSNYMTGRDRKHGITKVATRKSAISVTILLFALSCLSMGADAQSANLTFSSLAKCSDSSFNLSSYGVEDVLEPCVLYDIRDFSEDDVDDVTAEVTLVQVTPTHCHNHRDGAVTAVNVLNANNDNMGTRIGYFQDHYVKFRLVSIVAGNTNNVDDETYKVRAPGTRFIENVDIDSALFGRANGVCLYKIYRKMWTLTLLFLAG